MKRSLLIIGGHIEVHIQSTPRRLVDAIYHLTHKKKILKKNILIFVAGGTAIDKKIEQVNKVIAKKAKTNNNNS